MKHPHIFCRLETRDKIYEVTDYDIHMERQRPTLAKLTLKEPIETGIPAILELGYLGQAYRMCAVKTLGCLQIAPKTFDAIALEPVRDILDAQYIDQLVAADLVAAMKSIAARFGLSFKSKGIPPVTTPKNLLFLGSVRNALDQLWQVFKLGQARWLINLLTQELQYLPDGKFVTKSTEIPMDYFKQETHGGVELNIVPMFRPYTPVTWRDEEKIIDIARLNSRTRSMFITFAEAA